MDMYLYTKERTEILKPGHFCPVVILEEGTHKIYTISLHSVHHIRLPMQICKSIVFILLKDYYLLVFEKIDRFVFIINTFNC